MLRFTIPLDVQSRPATTKLVQLVAAACAEASGQKRPISEIGERVKAAIRQGSVWLGHHRVKQPDLNLKELRLLAIELQDDAVRRNPEKIREIQVFWPEKPIAEYSMDPAQVIWEDAHLLIVYKPAGVNTCQSVFSDTNCLTWGVQKLLDARCGFTSDPDDTEAELPGRYIVRTINRLDYATRGLVFYAKHKNAEKALHRMFMDRRVHKRYLVATPALTAAAAQSYQPGLSLVINDPVEWQGKVQNAVTLVRLLARSPERWWWAALPQTGRTHQIRKHFAAHLIPIEGDLAYGGPALDHDDPEGEPATGSTDPDSLMLACVAYRFRHPITGERLQVQHLPPEFAPV